MGTIKFSALGTGTIVLSTEMNSITEGSFTTLGASVTVAERDILADFKLTLGTQTARGTSPAVYLWLLPLLGGDYSTTDEESLENPVIFNLKAGETAAKIVTATNISLPNSSFKAIAKNSTGQTWNSSGNTIEIYGFHFDSV